MWFVFKEQTSSNSFILVEYWGGYIQTFCFVCLDSPQLGIKLFTFWKGSIKRIWLFHVALLKRQPNFLFLSWEVFLKTKKTQQSEIITEFQHKKLLMSSTFKYFGFVLCTWGNFVFVETLWFHRSEAGTKQWVNIDAYVCNLMERIALIEVEHVKSANSQWAYAKTRLSGLARHKVQGNREGN